MVSFLDTLSAIFFIIGILQLHFYLTQCNSSTFLNLDNPVTYISDHVSAKVKQVSDISDLFLNRTEKSVFPF